jgi:rod shape-determining protein MreD
VISTPGAFVRLGLLVFFAVVLQISGMADFRILGGSPDLLVLTVAAVAFFTGSVAGSITGFCAGLLFDLALGQNLGASSLVLTAAGYSIGRYRELRDPAHGLLPIAVGGLATLEWVLGFAAVSFMLEIEASVSAVVIREMIVTVLLNAILALPVFAFVRRVLRPVLMADPMESRRRRAQTRETGPIGLRGLEIGR